MRRLSFPLVYIAYVDESGDDGANGSRTYSLGCVMVDTEFWTTTFDQLISFRRHVRDVYGIPIRTELKANYLLDNRGPLRERPLPPRARFRLYRTHMRLQGKLGLTTFAVVIDKAKAAQKFGSARASSDIAWEYLLQRLERRATTEQTQMLVMHDDGDATTIRKRVRKARRAGTAGSAFGTGRISVPFTRVLDDPIARDSRQSYFVQLADLNAYAAFRRLYPPPARHRVQIVPQLMWDELGDALFTKVRRAAGAPAIVPGP